MVSFDVDDPREHNETGAEFCEHPETPGSEMRHEIPIPISPHVRSKNYKTTLIFVRPGSATAGMLQSGPRGA